MTFSFPCRDCGHANDAEWSQIGKAIPCGGCGKTVTVPAPMETVGGPAEPVPAPVVRFRCPSCGRKFATKPEMAGKKIACNRCGAGVRVPGGDAADDVPSSSRPAMTAHAGAADATAPSRPDRGRAARGVVPPADEDDSTDSSLMFAEIASDEEVKSPRAPGRSCRRGPS